MRAIITMTTGKTMTIELDPASCSHYRPKLR